MKINPQIKADLEEYPELRRLYDSAIISVVKLMQLHDIVDLRRIRKSGVFEHAYEKDIVTPLGLPNVPASVTATRYAAGKALLDYLETIGLSGLSLDLEQGDSDGLVQIWSPAPKACATKKPEEPDVAQKQASEKSAKPEDPSDKNAAKQEKPSDSKTNKKSESAKPAKTAEQPEQKGAENGQAKD